MLDLTGIVVSNGVVNTQPHQKLPQQRVPLVDPLGDRQPFVRQLDVAEFIHCDEAAVFQKTHSAADTGLGVSHVLHNVNGTNHRIGLGENMDSL